jgi:MFS superfamily sulfate permease-like transporter
MVRTIDLTATASLKGLVRALAGRGTALHLAELRDDVADELRAHGAEVDLGSVAPHRSIDECL